MAYVKTHNSYTSGAAQSTVTANEITLTFQGNALGRAQTASSQIQYGTQGVYEIGSIFPAEHVYTKYEGRLTLERVMIKNQSLADLHIAPLGSDVLKTGTIDVVIKNRDDNNHIIAAYLGCTAESYHMEVRANTMVSETINMVYLKASLAK